MATKQKIGDANRARMSKVIELLKREYPEAQCSLLYKNPYELLIATMLSAQCTDERVNQVTPVLFKKFPDAHAMAKATQAQIEAIIRTTGFFRSKAKGILETSKRLASEFGGKVPADLDTLVTLRGVGRKTANVVLGNAFNTPGMVVDTHVGRISRRLGFTYHTDPEKVEQELMLLVPRDTWTIYSHWLIDHGRAVCSARTLPKCEACVLAPYCPKKF